MIIFFGGLLGFELFYEVDITEVQQGFVWKHRRLSSARVCFSVELLPYETFSPVFESRTAGIGKLDGSKHSTSAHQTLNMALALLGLREEVLRAAQRGDHDALTKLLDANPELVNCSDDDGVLTLTLTLTLNVDSILCPSVVTFLYIL